MTTTNNWWRGAIIYQIYPRSFFDSNQDGIGDLPGVTQRLDYVASLGVDAIWLSPFFTSPMKDFGYDVSDYRNVDPIFGSLEDFDALIAKARSLGLKVIIDHVLSHSSDQHPWFQESRSSRNNARADWYVWADPKPDGTPPNNWLSVFGGSAWAWDSRRRQYYLHNFLSSQPDLNYHNPAVVEQLLSDLRFWLDRGVDGFRLDAVNFCYHDNALRDNPPSDRIVEGSIGVRAENPYAYQRHLYDKTRPENLELLKRIRHLLDQYPGTTSVGEIGDDNSLQTMAAYTADGNKLHMAYSFDLLTENCDIDYIHRTVATIEDRLHDGWPCWAMGNHDVTRLATRWGDGLHNAERARLFMVLLLTLRGSACLYQGEELGLEEAELAYHELVDPYGIAFWPEYKGRDGCRTPMPWEKDTKHAGFTKGRPWLPVDPRHQAHAIVEQDKDPDSLLNSYRSFILWRKGYQVLVQGEIRFYDSPVNTLCFERFTDDERILVTLNFSPLEQAWPVRVEGAATLESTGESLNVVNASWESTRVIVGPFSAGFARITTRS